MLFSLKQEAPASIGGGAFTDRLKEFSECTDIAQKTYVIGCMDWPSNYYRCDLLEQVLKLKALAEREQA